MPAYMTTEMTIAAFTGSRCAISVGDSWEARFYDECDKPMNQEWQKYTRGRAFYSEIDLVRALGDWYRTYRPRKEK